VITILADHNFEGQAALLLAAIATEGWLDLVPLQLRTFADEGLPIGSRDRVIWRYAQAHGMVLLTDNRNMKGADSLEQTFREEGTPTSLPVLTVGNAQRLTERDYRVRCAERLVEIILDLELYRGVGRLFIP
jgi:hypothetical protein